jgi:Uma2 family endonuclease
MESGMPVSAERRLTYDDFLLFPDDGLRHELIDGAHYVSPGPNMRHQELLGRLHFEIEWHLRQHPGSGRVFLAPFDVVFTRWDVVEPDLLFIASDQAEILTAKNVQGAPALVVEILSPGTRRTDEQPKRRLYDRGGVREYWLVDPDASVVTIFRRESGGTFAPVARLAARDRVALATPLLPGFSLPLVELFA